MVKIKAILHPTDFSEYSGAATKYACALAEKFDAQLHLLHVLQLSPNPTPVFGAGLALPSHVKESREASEAALRRVLDPDWAHGQRAVCVTTEGPPFLEIIRYAKENAIDMIVMGTHGRSGLVHVLMGSVAEKVVRKSPCPVLTVRPSDHQFVMP